MWVVDTCVLLDIALDDPQYAEASVRAVRAKILQGLTVCNVTYVELAPQFAGRINLLEEFLVQTGVSFDEPWIRKDSENAAVAFSRYIRLKHAGKARKRPIADVLIGAYAQRFKGLITRNAGDFKDIFPKLKIFEPV